jgi:predicted  nucleic acid-binding Zn-ribbon protein
MTAPASADLRTLLRDLHTSLLRKGLLRDEAEQEARQRKRLENRIANAKKALQEHLDAIKHLKVSAHEKEVSIKANQQQSARYLWQRNQVKEQKEYDALTHEMDNLKQINNVLEDEALAALTAIDEKTAQTPTLEAAIAQAQADLDRWLEEQKQAGTEREKRLKATEAETAELLNRLSPDVRKVYDRMFAALGADCLAVVQRRSCFGCHTELTGQQFNDLMLGRLVCCKSCSRLLYPEAGGG